MEENHNHWCVDEYVNGIRSECTRLLKAWRAGLTCKKVKNLLEPDSLAKVYDRMKELADEATFMAEGD